ncbi:hypothetical protein PF010_g27363 [Phytophthora fragariae]|uniref:Uncharacterized protein n=1 Tax=Phytophthora fragariae TaxID=53985 RepID=A0A6G0JU21_9STRA|nr:hypothetical protein PF010_g27363 [Phytophthora fragariae]
METDPLEESTPEARAADARKTTPGTSGDAVRKRKKRRSSSVARAPLRKRPREEPNASVGEYSALVSGDSVAAPDDVVEGSSAQLSDAVSKPSPHKKKKTTPKSPQSSRSSRSRVPSPSADRDGFSIAVEPSHGSSASTPVVSSPSTAVRESSSSKVRGDDLEDEVPTSTEETIPLEPGEVPPEASSEAVIVLSDRCESSLTVASWPGEPISPSASSTSTLIFSSDDENESKLEAPRPSPATVSPRLQPASDPVVGLQLDNVEVGPLDGPSSPSPDPAGLPLGSVEEDEGHPDDLSGPDNASGSDPRSASEWFSDVDSGESVVDESTSVAVTTTPSSDSPSDVIAETAVERVVVADAPGSPPSTRARTRRRTPRRSCAPAPTTARSRSSQVVATLSSTPGADPSSMRPLPVPGEPTSPPASSIAQVADHRGLPQEPLDQASQRVLPCSP